MLNGALVTSFEKWQHEIVLKAKALKVLKMWYNTGLAFWSGRTEEEWIRWRC